MSDPADYLLEKQAVINLPDEIDHAAYELILHRILQGRELHGNKPLMLYCRSNGGSAWDAEAICALIQADGNIDGILIGETMSAGSFIWASCARRYVYPDARMGIHPAARDAGYRIGNELRGLVEESEWIDRYQCRMYAGASSRDYDWWWAKLHAPGDVKWLNEKELIDIGMAFRFVERISVGVYSPNGAKSNETT